MTTPVITNYPFQTAVGNTIYNMVLNDVLPEYNASLSVVLDTDAPQFTNTKVIYGNPTTINEPTICVYIPQNLSNVFASSMGRHNYKVVVSLRLPYVSGANKTSGNEPEAIARCGDLFCDTVANAFTQAININVTAKNASGKQILPDGHAVIQRALFTGSLGYQQVKDQAGTLLYWKFDCFLQPLINVNFNRTDT